FRSIVMEDGTFHSAKVIDKNESITVIPCTEDSASRTSGVTPYPLHDKLMYVAGDFEKYCDSKKNNPFKKYMELLGEWVSSPYIVAKVKSIYQYVLKGRVMQDLVEAKILHLDVNGRLIEKWDKKISALYGEKPPIFSAIANKQSDAFIRFNVRSTEKTF